jgi:hypothetical protein
LTPASSFDDVQMARRFALATGAALLLVAAACTGDEPGATEQPVLVHVQQPKTLMPDWEHDAVWAAWEAACPEDEPGRVSWRTHRITPRLPNASSLRDPTAIRLPTKMTGTIQCDDGSRHFVVVLFDR